MKPAMLIYALGASAFTLGAAGSRFGPCPRRLLAALIGVSAALWIALLFAFAVEP